MHFYLEIGCIKYLNAKVSFCKSAPWKNNVWSWKDVGGHFKRILVIIFRSNYIEANK